MVLGVPFCVNRFYAGEIRRYCERLLAVEARTAHVRLGLTYSFILRRKRGICKGNTTSAVGRTGAAEVQGPRSAVRRRAAICSRVSANRVYLKYLTYLTSKTQARFAPSRLRDREAYLSGAASVCGNFRSLAGRGSSLKFA